MSCVDALFPEVADSSCYISRVQSSFDNHDTTVSTFSHSDLTHLSESTVDA